MRLVAVLLAVIILAIPRCLIPGLETLVDW